MIDDFDFNLQKCTCVFQELEKAKQQVKEETDYVTWSSIYFYIIFVLGIETMSSEASSCKRKLKAIWLSKNVFNIFLTWQCHKLIITEVMESWMNLTQKRCKQIRRAVNNVMESFDVSGLPVKKKNSDH